MFGSYFRTVAVIPVSDFCPSVNRALVTTDRYLTVVMLHKCDPFSRMSLNLKLGNLKYLHVYNLQVLLIILILKSGFYSKKKRKKGCYAFLKVACVAEAILRKSA